MHGIQRLSYTEEYRKGVDFVSGEMKNLKMDTYEDFVGNLVGVLKGSDEKKPAIITGSHLDTVRCGGAFDGIAGIACAMETVRMIKKSGVPLKHTLKVLATIEEEGTCFGMVTLGSSFFTGKLDISELKKYRCGEGGNTFEQILSNYRKCREAYVCREVLEPIRAFIEIHGEQGPVLENRGIQTGIVDCICGIIWMEISIMGMAGHSGTVPMNERKDAGIAACEFILRLNRMVTEKYNGKAVVTAGKIHFDPGSANCIPGRSVFSLDIRSGNDEILQNISDYTEFIKKSIEEDGFLVTIQEQSRRRPVLMDQKLRLLMEKSCEALNITYIHMDSGAGHDAMVFAEKFPTAMLFLPNRNGISHHPDEYIDEKSLKYGAEVLYQMLRALDKE